MTKNAFRSTTAAVVFLSLTAAALAVTGEFDNMCTTGLAMRKKVPSDCSVHATFNKKTYCFGDQDAELVFFKDPSGTIAKAEEYYKTIKN